MADNLSVMLKSIAPVVVVQDAAALNLSVMEMSMPDVVVVHAAFAERL